MVNMNEQDALKNVQADFEKLTAIKIKDGESMTVTVLACKYIPTTQFGPQILWTVDHKGSKKALWSKITGQLARAIKKTYPEGITGQTVTISRKGSGIKDTVYTIKQGK